jgi:hypothetical protein
VVEVVAVVGVEAVAVEGMVDLLQLQLRITMRKTGETRHLLLLQPQKPLQNQPTMMTGVLPQHQLLLQNRLLLLRWTMTGVLPPPAPLHRSPLLLQVEEGMTGMTGARRPRLQLQHPLDTILIRPVATAEAVEVEGDEAEDVAVAVGPAITARRRGT